LNPTWQGVRGSSIAVFPVKCTESNGIDIIAPIPEGVEGIGNILLTVILEPNVQRTSLHHCPSKERSVFWVLHRRRQLLQIIRQGTQYASAWTVRLVAAYGVLMLSSPSPHSGQTCQRLEE
jgi:hypothetical protein